MPNFVTVGDTAKVTATFKDWDGSLADPTTVTFTVYDDAKQTVSSEVLGEDHKKSAGVWEAYFTPSEAGTYLCEFKGTLSGNPVARKVRVDAVEVVE